MKQRTLWRIVGLVAVSALSVSVLPAAAADAKTPSTDQAPSPPGRHRAADQPTRSEIAQAQASIAASLRAGAAAAGASTRTTSAAPSLSAKVRSSLLRPEAAASMTDCSVLYEGPFLCGSIQVPTSATDPSLGTRTIDFVYRPADTQPATGVSLFSDGTVQSTFSESSTWKPGFFSWIATAQGAESATRDVILVNTRGTGRDAVDCPLLQGDGNTYREAVAECVGILGRSIDYFTTGDSADDLDAVRAHLLGRTARVDLVTMGHSTSLGQAYLARYPQRIRTAILDEAQSMNAWGDVEIKDSTAIVGLVCRRSDRCRAQIDDAITQVAWLAAKVRQSPITGMTTLADGTPQRIVLGEVELAWGLVAREPATYAHGAGLAAAIKAYRGGDAQPLLRIAANAGIGEGWSGAPLTGPEDELGNWSASGFAAANCNEWSTAYDLGADEQTRRSQAVQRLAAQPANLYGIFSHAIFGNWEECWAWPGPQRVNKIQPLGVPYAKVPVLVMSGDLNTDHPPTAAETVASRYPNATFVPIPQGAQPSLGWSECAARVMQHFFATKSAGDTRCAANEGKAVLGIGAFPKSVLGEAPGRPASAADRSTARDQRVAAVAVHTEVDAILQAFEVGAESGPALRGGSWSVEFGQEGAVLTLAGARFARDVTVNGVVDFSFFGDNPPATLTVSGPGTDAGELVVDMPALFSLDHPTAHVTGQIGGRPIDVTVDLH